MTPEMKPGGIRERALRALGGDSLVLDVRQRIAKRNYRPEDDEEQFTDFDE